MYPELKTNLVKAYNRYADDRDKREIDAWKIQERDHFVTLLKEQQKRTLLEIGAGTGKDSQSFQESGFEVVCTDGALGMVKLCRKKGLTALVTDFYNLGFTEESFDAIWALNCLLHVPKKELPAVLRGIRSVLKPMGLFYMGVWGGTESEGVWDSDSYTPKRFFSLYPDQQIQTVVADLFEVFYFKAVSFENLELHFQSMILEK
jgi:ubiquinone/menaquinone biosynthesis C-methylase UbiE